MQAGANVDAQCDSGLTALHVACRGQAVLVATLLLAASCDASLQDSRGCTALHYAAQTANWGLFSLLHAHPGCRPKSPDAKGSLHGILAQCSGSHSRHGCMDVSGSQSKRIRPQQKPPIARQLLPEAGNLKEISAEM